MAVELDHLDQQILRILLRDGRTPAAQIADEVKLSRPSVAERIDKLEKAGVIRGTTVVVEPGALGQVVTAFIAARGNPEGPKAWRMFRDLRHLGESGGSEEIMGDEHSGLRPAKSFAGAAWAVALADVSMSLDNVLAVAGAAREHPGILAVGLILSTVIAVFGWMNAERLMRLMGATPSMIDSSLGYAQVMFAGNATVTLLFLNNAIFRGAGDPAIAMRVLWTANLIN